MKVSLKASVFLSLLSLSGILVAIGYLGFKNFSGKPTSSTHREMVRVPDPPLESDISSQEDSLKSESSRTEITYDVSVPVRQKSVVEYFSYYFPRNTPS